MGYWLIAQCDTYSPAASAAKVAFEKAFPSSKQPEALVFCKDEILNVSLHFHISLRLCLEYMSTFIINSPGFSWDGVIVLPNSCCVLDFSMRKVLIIHSCF